MQPRIVISGTHSGAGKTTLTTGVLRALYNRGLKVQPFKSGPDYIDPAFHSFVVSRASRNLDVWMLGEETTKNLFVKNAKDADISVIEGVMGLYDGLGTQKDMGSTAHLSKVLSAPVILLVDGSGMSASAAAIVTGYKMYDENVNIAGVILNNMHGEKHYNLLRQAIERDTGIPCVGYLNKNSAISLKSRHLGLVPSGEVDELDSKLNEVASMVTETVDLDKIIEIARGASLVEGKSTPVMPRVDKPVRIAIARDRAFNFYYEDSLDLIEELGGQLVPFSPITDKDLPEDIGGIILGGGFPEVFAKDISENLSMKSAIRKAADAGMPIYAECGGLMYLCDSIENLESIEYDMVGIFPFKSKMTKRLQRFGYVEVEVASDSPISSEHEETFKAHEFHRSIVEHGDKGNFAYHVTKARPGEKHVQWSCGHLYKNCLGAYAHVHFYSNINLAKNFVVKCSNYINAGTGKDV